MIADAQALHADALIVNGLIGSTAVPQHLGDPISLFGPMRAGNVTAGNLTVAPLDAGFTGAMQAMARTIAAIEASEDPLRIATSTDDIRAAKEEGGAAIILGFQNAKPLDDQLEHLDAFHRLGLRILQLTYQRRNLVADGCGEPADAGLSLFGRSVIQRCNELGILIDLSHVNDRATRETIELSADPVSFTHVNMRARHDVSRNKSDADIRALAERGGVVGINAVARLMSPTGRAEGATIEMFADQVDHVAELVGPDHVAIGLDINEGMTEADFMARRQGFLTRYPELRFGGDFPFEHYYVFGLTTMANLSIITEELVRRGWGAEDVRKVLGGNFMRLFDAVWR